MTDVASGATPYDVLGVDRHASAEDLRRAYRRRQRQTHPDLGGDPAAFHAVQLAWERVGTAAGRAEYDRTAGGAPRSARFAEDDEGTRVWTTGTRRGSASAPGRARSYGHPGGASRQRYLTLMREWVGRGVDLSDPYQEDLVQRAPAEIRHALADALAEEATARTLSALGPAFAVWHDVATAAGGGGWADDADIASTEAAKIDHVVLGPTGVFVLQSEDWGAPVRPRGAELASAALAPGEQPVRSLARRARIARSWRVAVTALVVVLPDGALDEDVILLRRGRGRRPARLAVRRSSLGFLLTVGLPGSGRLPDAAFFELRTRLQEHVRFV
ncbi:J domain-containing protein [Georgenia subflava]|uniref:DnaJ domain-containing protein n=1 Tax=Georgenia subflava TaxID=1622177 RepID=A0A6N7EIS7_9MICO|nr:DnaJ domain-containing protein [Georgenia subflava]MPV36983.1 DnaJ domain-containing protein [Georgenia subflava]